MSAVYNRGQDAVLYLNTVDVGGVRDRIVHKIVVMIRKLLLVVKIQN